MGTSRRGVAIVVVALACAATTVACTPTVTTVTVTAGADTLVDATTTTTNYGTTNPIVVDASPQREVLLRFDLTTLTGTVRDAKLRLHVSNVANSGSPDGGRVSRVEGDWTETGVTWSNRPTAWGPVAGELGAVTADTWVELTVTNIVTVGGVLTLGLRSPNTDGAYYDSRESGANAPQLVVTRGAAPAAVTGAAIAAVGDMVCVPGAAVTATTCRQVAVSNRLLADSSVSTLLALGDLQYEKGELASFQTAYETSFGRLKAKTRPAVGNHEYETAGATGYYTYFGAAAGDPAKGYYSFDLGTTWHVVVLNSNCSIVSCAAGSVQEQWLRADLAATTRTCLLAAWHHPRFTSSASHTNDPTVAPFWDALQQYKAEVVLNGHVHNYERFAPQLPNAAASSTGIQQFVVGTGGKSMYGFAAAQPNSLVRLQGFGYLRMVLGSTSYSWTFVDEAGVTRDLGTAACH